MEESESLQPRSLVQNLQIADSSRASNRHAVAAKYLLTLSLLHKAQC